MDNAKTLKDRGDNAKKNKIRAKKDVKTKNDRGDSQIKSFFDKSSESVKRAEIKSETPKTFDITKRQSEYEKENKKLMEKRRKIRDKYTIKNYLGPDVNKQVAPKEVKVEIKKDVAMPSKQEQNDKIILTKSDTKTYKIEKENQKVPVIKTITCKHDSRVYKAVTFRAPRQKPTSLQINIPTVTRNNNHINRIPKLIKQKLNTPSKTSVKPNTEKKIGRKCRRWTRGQISSPVLRTGHSPTTEVAKWAPDCINKHTKPYYEAWINTTLTAISKDTKGKNLNAKQLMKSFKQALERVQSPDLVYKDFTDERNVGRIKINHK
ncbi:hypothetical protein KGM_215145 [Danaus plexippus plexippus]|uniref:Uncharacterized protein n=1 Tax=Danaus plexippus plexippus TaxID=278856 RepID=A0A212EKF2_DANPL|nr:hypothetical protein KGM_215145 [Danaus plexippus plexippus]